MFCELRKVAAAAASSLLFSSSPASAVWTLSGVMLWIIRVLDFHWGSKKVWHQTRKVSECELNQSGRLSRLRVRRCGESWWRSGTVPPTGSIRCWLADLQLQPQASHLRRVELISPRPPETSCGCPLCVACRSGRRALLGKHWCH